MGKVKDLKVELFSVDGSTGVTLNYSGDEAVLERFKWAITEFHELGLEFTWVVVLHNVSLVENQIWWQWNEMIEDEASRAKQNDMAHKREQYMKQSRDLLLSFGNNLYNGYDALAFSAYSSEMDFSTNYETVIMESESPLGPALSYKTGLGTELSVGEESMRHITEQLMRFINKIKEMEDGR